MKERQAAKIRQLGEALIATGYRHLDEQALVLGLSRSTTWTIRRGPHKNSGLSASVIRQMLDQPRLPALVQRRILEYVEEKSAGMYGHNSVQVRRFAAALARKRERDTIGNGADSARRQAVEPKRDIPIDTSITRNNIAYFT
jgi:hypothetical protein